MVSGPARWLGANCGVAILTIVYKVNGLTAFSNTNFVRKRV